MATVKANGKYQYPLVPREYWPAVKFACKMIRENGYRNKAIRIAANYYDVDENELSKHVAARSAAGKRPKGYKMKWFVVARASYCEAWMDRNWSFRIEYGKTAEGLENKFRSQDWNETIRNDYGGNYVPLFDTEILSEHGSKEEALEELKRIETMSEEELEKYTKGKVTRR